MLCFLGTLGRRGLDGKLYAETMQQPSSIKAQYLARRDFTQSGSAFSTPSSELVPGIKDAAPVMLKVALIDEEARGSALLQWWQGRGSATVLERDQTATLMIRATGSRNLIEMAHNDLDVVATQILTTTVLTLHDGKKPGPDVDLVPLRQWFSELLESTSTDPLIRGAADLVEALLTETRPEDERALHGDIHHGNVLDFGDRWAAIDPKGLVGHRVFDYVNIVCNPSTDGALENLHNRLENICELARIDRALLAPWTIAWCGLSLTWMQGGEGSSGLGRTTRQVAGTLLSDL